MYLILILSALLLPSLTHSADDRGKEEKALVAVGVPGGSPIVPGAPRALPPTGPGPRVSVPSLVQLTTDAARQFLTTIDEKVLQVAIDELVRVWTSSPLEQDFVALLGRSQEIINKLFPGLNRIVLGVDIQNLLYAPLVHLFLQNPDIVQRINTIPLFAIIGRWPGTTFEENISIEEMQFSDHGYVAAESRLGLHLFNCTGHTMRTLRHAWLEEKDRYSSAIKFACDGSAVAAVIRFHEGGAFSRITIFDSASGELVHEAQNIRDVSTAPVIPLFTYIDHENNAVMYDCKSRKTVKYPTIRAEETIVLPPVVSPRGTCSAYVIKGTGAGDTNDVYVQNNSTGKRYLLMRLTEAFSRGAIKFNAAETVVVVRDPRDEQFKFFNLDNLVETADEQAPYLVVRNYRFSPQGTQLFISGKSSGKPDSIVDLRTRTTLETFAPSERIVEFLSEDIILVSLESKKIPRYDLYVRDRKQRIALLPPPLDGYCRSIYEKSMQLVYRDMRTNVCIFDIRKQQGCMVRKSPKQHEMWGFDTQGTLYDMGMRTIEQLMINPTDCSLNQLFFLLGIVRALREGTPDEIYKQLLASPLLTTFSPIIEIYLTEYINNKRVSAVASLAAASPKKEEPKRVASVYSRGNNKKNKNKKRVAA